jgi:broad specificity phosphatase PhoE
MSEFESNCGKTHCLLLVLRHATSAEPDRVLGSETDVGLSDQGRVEAEEVAARLSRVAPRPVAVYSSPLRRARLTAEPIARALGVDLLIENDLRERAMGDLSGRRRIEVMSDYLRVLDCWIAGDLDYTNAQGESFRQVAERARSVLERIARGHLGRTVVVVTHGMWIRVALSTLPDAARVASLKDVGIGCVAVNELFFEPVEEPIGSISLRPDQSYDPSRSLDRWWVGCLNSRHYPDPDLPLEGVPCGLSPRDAPDLPTPSP